VLGLERGKGRINDSLGEQTLYFSKKEMGVKEVGKSP
jgi:hypothetical protein